MNQKVNADNIKSILYGWNIVLFPNQREQISMKIHFVLIRP